MTRAGRRRPRRVRVRIALLYLTALLLTLGSARPARAQGLPPVTFDRPPAQGPGTPGWGALYDPTIQPFTGAIPAPISSTASIDLQGNGHPDVVVCHGSNPPNPIV